MKNLLQTHSISWAQSVKLTLEAEGINAVVLDEHSPGYMGFAGRVRVAVVNDADLKRAQSVVAHLSPPRGPPPASWRVQKRGLQLLALGLILSVVAAGLSDRFEPGPLVYASLVIGGLAFLGGFLLIALGWRADKQPSDDEHAQRLR